ncbi:MAG TPA: response regulator transcription factor [Oscillospiraceae bacterium]|nr:response regulator transcription factor [Oscillospiraceae bacterium]HNW05214.1 response regulator transcription factor [Oscillospiraceae bacterium]HPW00528.1 response regulator transcription factor [Oscillospiraceae bacterium]
MIFCVEDDPSVRDIEVYTLESVGFKAEGFADGASFFEALKARTPELVLLDVMLPGEDGTAILKKLKANPSTSALPVIMATAKDAESSKVLSLDLGADDYLVKPFGMMEMAARVKAVLRRSAPAQDAPLLQAGGLVMNLGEHLVTADGERVTLTLKEFELLRLFLSHPGMVFTRDRLLSGVWGMEYDGETRTVDVHIRTLRRKLGAYGDLIETVRGVGYRMEAGGV